MDASPLTGRKQVGAAYKKLGWKNRKYTYDTKYFCVILLCCFLKFSTHVDVILFLFTFVLAKTQIVSQNIMKFLAAFILFKP